MGGLAEVPQGCRGAVLREREWWARLAAVRLGRPALGGLAKGAFGRRALVVGLRVLVLGGLLLFDAIGILALNWWAKGGIGNRLGEALGSGRVAGRSRRRLLRRVGALGRVVAVLGLGLVGRCWQGAFHVSNLKF